MRSRGKTSFRVLVGALGSLAFTALAQAGDGATAPVDRAGPVRQSPVTTPGSGCTYDGHPWIASSLALEYALRPGVNALSALAQAVRQAGQSAEAQVLFQRAALEGASSPRSTVRGAAILARGHLQEAVRFHASDYKSVLIELARAYALQPEPVLLFNLARAAHLAQCRREATVFYQRFLQALEHLQALPTGGLSVEGLGADVRSNQPSTLPVVRRRVEGYLSALNKEMAAEARVALVLPPPLVQPPAQHPLPSPPAVSPPPRPLARYLDMSAGLVLGFRTFSLSGGNGVGRANDCYVLDQQTPQRALYLPIRCSGYAAASLGVHADAAIYPLGGWRWFRGLGITGALDVFRPTLNPCSENGTCAPDTISALELHLRVGLRWVITLWNRLDRPAVALLLDYGLHQVSLDRGAPSEHPALDWRLPDIRYQFFAPGLGGRFPLYVRRLLYVGGSLTFQYHFVGSYGDLQERFLSSPSGGYGPIKDSSGLRLDARLEAIVWRGLTVRLGGYYERYAMSFTLADAGAGYPLPPATDRTTDARAQYLAQSAIDQFYGGSLSLAYQY